MFIVGRKRVDMRGKKAKLIRKYLFNENILTGSEPYYICDIRGAKKGRRFISKQIFASKGRAIYQKLKQKARYYKIKQLIIT